MKHIVSLLLALVLCLSCTLIMSACDGASDPIPSGTQKDTDAEVPTNGSTETPTEAPTEAPVTPSQPMIPTGTKNAVAIRYTLNGNNTVTATVSVEGDVCFAGLTGDLNYDNGTLTLVSSETLLSGMVVNTGNSGKISFSYASASNLTSAQQLFKATFAYSGSVNTNLTFSIDPDDFSNASLENVIYSTFGQNLVIG